MNKTDTYPKWIDEYAESVYQAFANMIPTSFGPVDGLALARALNGKLIERLYEAIEIIKIVDTSKEEMKNVFLAPSSIRTALFLLFGEHMGSPENSSEKHKKVFTFLVDLLYHKNIGTDPWARAKNTIHTDGDIENLLKTTPLLYGTPESARELGRLYNSMAATSYALYRDFFPQEALEVYGPYNVSEHYGEGAILIIKEFVRVHVPQLWPKIQSWPPQKIQILQVYQNVSFRCEIIGMHSLYEGDVINNLCAYSVRVCDSLHTELQEIISVRKDIEQFAIKQFLVYKHMSHDELKQQTLLWLTHQYSRLFELADMDWHPTKEMRSIITNVEIPERLIIKSMPTYSEFIQSPQFEIFWLKKLFLS